MTQPISPDEGDALKACPFCGAKDGRLVQAFTRATDSFAYWSVECLDCACEIASDTSQSEADAAWNTRTDPPVAMDDLIKRLRRGRLMQEGSGNWGDLYQSAHPDAIEAADRIQSLIADNERLREALTIIAGDLNYGHCAKCKQPCEGVTMCDCNVSWEPNDPVAVARAALSHKDSSK